MLAQTDRTCISDSPAFRRRIRQYLSDADLREMRRYLAQHPDAGIVARHGGGVRKLRWSGLGRGKRGGVRVLYYWLAHRREIWLLDCYAKGKEDNIPGFRLHQIKDDFVRRYRPELLNERAVA